MDRDRGDQCPLGTSRDSPWGGQQGQGGKVVGEELGVSQGKAECRGILIGVKRRRDRVFVQRRTVGCESWLWEQDAAARWDFGFLFAPTSQQNFLQCFTMRKFTSRDCECLWLAARGV